MRHYPTAEDEARLKEWDANDPAGWLNFASLVWNHHYGRIWEEDGLTKMATGGWSGNESILSAMRENVLWSLLWESSHRGGLVVFRLPKT